MESSRGAAAAAPGLPPRPTQAPDRRAAPTQAAAPAPLPLAASTLPPRGPTQPQPPPARQPQHAQPADMAAPRVREVPVAPAPAGAARPPSLLKPLLNAILQDDPADADQPGAPPAAAADRHEGQMSAAAGAQASYNPPYSTASVQVPQPGCSAADPAAMGPGTAGPHDSAGTFASVAGACEEEEEADGPRAGPAAPDGPGWAAPMAGAGAAGAAGAPAAAPEHAGATALLMQFLDNHQLVPDMVASQLDMPFPLLMSGPLGGEGAHAGGPTLSEASRQLPASSLSMKPPEGDVAGGAGAGRRSRKRNAAASVGESVGAVSGKMTSLPGRRGRSVDEEDGFGVAMSQQVGYEAVAAAPPPRTTRSSSRARR
ncbi:hypothetical protein Agub_g4767 [Astrephomene gubernaculifera]|uniref:Uncharacterized protein n=1 Tax=Astrephomene gubernaculifera TaxID=47775 RepID=A0AAD3DKS3_9CHLO|nr:hypothetical protein Agub_g4767 [Astrephomene gubernaculifera]